MYKVRKVRNQPHFGIYKNGKLHSIHPTRRHAKKMMGGMINDPTENDEEEIYDTQQVVDRAAQDHHAGLPVDISNIEEDIEGLEQYLADKLMVDPNGNLIDQLIANGYTYDELQPMDLTTAELDALQEAYSPLTEEQQIELIEEQLHEDIPSLTGANLNSFARYFRYIGFTYLGVRTMSSAEIRRIVIDRRDELRQIQRERTQMGQHDPKTSEHESKRRK